MFKCFKLTILLHLVHLVIIDTEFSKIQTSKGWTRLVEVVKGENSIARRYVKKSYKDFVTLREVAGGCCLSQYFKASMLFAQFILSVWMFS